ncbi:hypothetical protein CPB83DRAFT_880201 [Crepidotus variabilis]|uniref:Uncharacterized protein n=1 Tax=Crepidotus variabilis TaxID=179855 RepID=A0A9P6ERA0_9AGAR|nr:hypothetical protein CPB83DRAFT_880201 [Crepidotus variabilis]
MIFARGQDNSQLPNPYAPEAWIPSTLAEIFRLHHCLGVGCMSIFLWDVLSSLVQDYIVVFRRKFTFQTAVFLTIRIATFLFLLGSAFVFMTDLDDCLPWSIVNSIGYITTHCATGLLFYFRVAAVYRGNPYIINFFRICWLSLVAGTIMGPATVTYIHIPPTRTCVIQVLPSKAQYPVVAALAQGFYDLLVCGFITYKLSSGKETESRSGTMGRRATRSWLGWKQKTAMFTRRFLQDSQLYFLLIACVKIPEIICFFAFQGSTYGSLAQLMLSFLDTVVVSILATKVYRKLKLGQPGLLDQASSHTQNISFLRKDTSGGTHLNSSNSGTQVTHGTSGSNKKSSRHSYPPVQSGS